ncbi:MAG: replicative DNA helicase [Peptococcaceae bacterium]|jgi:replicative DNA helicase|nr:replicative DNA helicase [Peptococcaceae bacterium]MDH7523780.1 replicative DNA helicase [Peptococcaceae bacterium]
MLEKIPPHNLEAEQAVLGSMMIDKEAVYTAVGILVPEDFYKESHQIIYSSLLSLESKGEPIDMITLTEELRQQNNLEKVGGVGYIATIANAVPTAANVRHYATIVAEKAVLRKLIRFSTNIANRCFEDQEDTFELLDDAERKILEIATKRSSDDLVPLKKVLSDTLEKIEMLASQKGSVTGVPSFYADLDRITSGWQQSDLIILAARPAMGKTSFGLNIALNAALKGKLPVAIFSLEMSREQLVQRMISSEAKIDQHKLRTGRLQDEEWLRLTRAVQPLSTAQIYIDDTPAISVLELRAKARRLKAEKGLELIVIDYLQLMQVNNRKNENRQQEISEISRSLKALARELNVPVLALSQLSRAVEQTHEKRPALSHLRESGALEQDADLVMFIYREEYYNPDTERPGIAEIIIAKHRNGPTGIVELGFIKEYTKFVDLDTYHTPA